MRSEEWQSRPSKSPEKSKIKHRAKRFCGKIKFVGAGALDSPLGGARFELSRAYVENIMWITQMRL